MSHTGQESVKCIHPYMHEMQWVFDDPAVDLDKEPFVNGADLLIDQLVTGMEDSWRGFNLYFSDRPFDGYTVMLEWDRQEADGNWYYCEAFNDYGWLCPALLKYFPEAPKRLYVGASPIHATTNHNSRAAKMASSYANKLEELERE